MIHASMSRGERIFSYTNWKYVLGQFGTLGLRATTAKVGLLPTSTSVSANPVRKAICRNG